MSIEWRHRAVQVLKNVQVKFVVTALEIMNSRNLDLEGERLIVEDTNKKIELAEDMIQGFTDTDHTPS